MKRKLPLALACCLATLGAIPARAEDAKPYDGEEDIANNPDQYAKDMIGAFGARKITIRVDRVIGQTVTGYSIVAGNERAFSGSWTGKGGNYTVVAKEPGDDKADGVFTFTWMRKTTSLVGEWQPNDKKIGVRKFDLAAREFKYNPKAGKYPQASTRKLTTKDVENLRNEELRLMRNEIYARHGYSFKLADMRDHFDKLYWYMPMAIDVTTRLTKIEQANAELIKRYENYSAEYYDSFGR